MAQALPSDRLLTRERRRWLAEIAREGGWHSRAAGAVVTLDSLGAIGFAAALGFGLAALPEGVVALSPWLALGLLSAIARGGCGLATARLGAEAARTAKARLRDRITRATFLLPAGSRPATGALMTAAVDRVRGDHARARRDAVDEHRARAALAEPAAVLRAVQAEIVAQDVQQRRLDGDLERLDPVVDGERHATRARRRRVDRRRRRRGHRLR